MRTTSERRQRDYRLVYELVYEKPRVQVKESAPVLGLNQISASRRMSEAFDFGYVLPPQLRKRSYRNMKEYMYFVNCKHPFRSFKELTNDMNVVYHARLGGSENLWIVSKQEIHVQGNVKASGLRSDYHVAFSPNYTWEKAVQIMQKKTEDFNPKEYEHRGIIKTHWDETIEWDQEDETLYREFKYDARKRFGSTMKKHLISGQKIIDWFARVHECCSVFTRYFPEGISAYDPYLLMFETDYEDFIIDLFSQLPTSPFFFKVSNMLFVYINMERSSLRKVGLNMSDISQLHIPILIDDLLTKEIIKNEEEALVAYYHRKEL